MEQDTEYTDVVFRINTTKDFKGTVFALMPHECCNYNGNVTTYQHLGQHSAADYVYCIYRSKRARPSEYADLKKELENAGYLVIVVTKQNYAKYLESYHAVRSNR